MALESDAWILHYVPGNIFEYLLDLGHQLGLGVPGRVVGVFPNCLLPITIHWVTTARIKRPETGAGKVVKTLWQSFLTLFRVMVKSQILPPHIWHSSSNLSSQGLATISSSFT